MKVLVAILISTFSLFLNAQPKELLKLEIKNIGPLINSAYSDYTPLVSADGSIMIFSSRKPATKTSTSNTTTTAKGTFSAIYITYFNDKSKSWLEPVLLEPVVNLQGVDNSAIALSNDGQRMLIYRSGLNKNINKGIYETTLNGNDWSVPKRLPSPINSDGNETSACFSPDGKTIYFVSNRIGGLGGRDIWYCTQNNSGEWDEAINLGESINTKEDEESIFLHPNGNSLFFSSKGHNSIGGYDIFVSHYDTLANVWMKAESMGASINTPVNDLDFVLTASGKTGYYTSIKPTKGLGDKDIYTVAFENNILKKEIRLLKGFITDENGLGVNSKIIIKDKLTGTVINSLKSNLATGKYLVPLQLHQEYEINVTDNNNGTYTDFIEVSDKINYHEIVKNVVLVPKFANVLSRVLDENGDPLSNVQIELIDVITKQLIGKFETNKSGGTRFSVPFDNKYNIVFSKPGYLFHSINIAIPKSVGSELKDIKNITLQKAEVGKKTTLNNIAFDFDQSLPGQQSYLDLDRVILLMKQMLSLQVEISGHTANVGFQDNKKLSEQMAKSVMGYLTSKGVEKNRLKYKGYGSSEPLTDNDTEEGRETNNRIEIKVLKVDLIAEQLAEELRVKNNEANVKPEDAVKPSNDDELQDENEINIDEVKEDESVDSIVKNETIETKEADIADVKEAESADAALETETVETKEVDVVDVKEAESSDAALETETVETKEADVADVKELESIDAAAETVTVETEEAVVVDVKELESTDAAVETETIETKEADVADVKELESADTALETEIVETKEVDMSDVKELESFGAAVETETVETKEADIAEVKELESVDSAVETETIETKEADIANVKEAESIDSAVETETVETKEADIADVIELENTDTALETETVETKEADVADVKEAESTDTAVEAETVETETIETKEADIADVKEAESVDAVETETVETKEADVVNVKEAESIDTAVEAETVETETIETKEADIADVKEEESVDAVETETVETKEADVANVKEAESPDTVIETETIETKEADVADVKELENTDTALETETVETKEADIADIKEEESIDTALETETIETKEAEVADVKEVENTDAAVETETIENKDADVVDVKKVENIETTEEGKEVREIKETDVSSLNQLENKNLSSDSQKIEIKNIGSQINTSFPDFGPFISADGLTMILSSRKPLDQKDLLKGKEGNSNIYVTHYDDKSKSWLKTTMLEPAINMPGIDNYAVALSNDGQRMLFYRGGKDKNVKTDIFESVLKGDEWSIPVVLPPPINSQDNETSASISPDGKTIYFVSDRTGGFGGKDIWYSTQSKYGKWSPAQNMGESVNSKEDEEYIFIHPNGSTLFFSSKGHNSMGGYDLFMVEVGDSSNTGNKPQSLGSAINTINDDIYFVLAADGVTAYYSAVESKGAKGSDIYSVTFSENIINKNAVLLKGRIMDEYGAFLKSKITITDKSTDSKVGVYTSNSALGKYLITLPTDKEYEIKVTAKGYTTFKDSIETSNKAGYKEYVKNVLLEPKNAFIISKTVDDNGIAISARIELFDKNKKQLVEKSKNDNEGNSRISVPSGKNFEMIFTKPGYFFQSLNVLIPNAIGYEKNLKNITLQKVESGKIVQLNNVSFESNQATLSRESFSDLDRVVSLMNDLVSLKIEIGDNSCNSASGKPDQILSKEKAKAVVDYIISKGIDKNRLVFKSYIAKGTSPDSKAKSETGTIQLKVLKIDSKSEQIAVEKLIQEAILADNQRDESDSFEGEELIDSDLMEGEEQYTDASNEEYNYSDEGYNEEYTDTTGSGEYSNEEYSDSTYEEYSEESFDEANPYDDGLSADSLMMEIKNIGSLVNSSFQDYLPLVHADGNAMIFTSNRLTNEMLPPVSPQAKKGKSAKKDNKAGKSSIYATYYDVKNKKWLSPKMLGPTINLPGVNNSAIALSNDGQKMLLYRNDKDQEGNGDIFESTLNGEEWTNPLRLPSSINSEDNETSASISPDGKTIYFVSNRKLGFGEKDIWFCTKEKSGIWGQAVNIGEYINTDKDEESVFIHPNGNSLFFSSKGHNTIGGYDIFISNFDSLSGQWGEARNLGKAINTPDDDLYFVLSANGKAGYYASSKTKGFGENDIYSVVVGDDIIKKNTTLVKGFITDEDGEGIKSKIEITDKTTDEPMGVFNSNKISGKYLISLPTGKKYEVKVISDGYTSYAMSIDITNKLDYNEILKNIVLETKNAFISSRMFNENGNPISVQVEAIDNTSLQLIDRSVSDNEGYSRIAVPSGKNLDIFYNNPGYLFQSINVVIPKSTGFESKNLRNITMQKAEVGKKTMLNTVSFENNQTIPRQESFLDLDRVIALMNDMSSLEIEIAVYTYNSGSEKDNAKLSKERAKALVDRLISKGCDKKRLSFKGYGSKMPFNTNDTEEGRKENNRTELKVLKMDEKAEQAALERRIATTTVDIGNDVKPDEIIVSADEVKIQKNKEIVVIADKNKENIDSVNVAKTQEKIETVVSSDTKDETTDSLEEEKAQENTESVVAADKNEDTVEQIEEEKTQENLETIVTSDTKDETTDSLEEEKTPENTESVVAADKNEDTIDPIEEEKIQENEETVVATDQNEATVDPIEEEKIQDNSETIVAADENEDTVDPIEEEKTQENEETVVAADKNEDTIDPIEEEKTQENEETVVATDQNEATVDPIEEEKTQENSETIVAADENEATVDPIEEEKAQENVETVVAADNKNEIFDPFEEEEKLEAQKALVTDVKKDEPFDPFEEEEKLEAQKALVTDVKKDEPFDPFEEEEKLEAQKALVTDVKKDEPFDPFEEEEKLEAQKALVTDVEKDEPYDPFEEEEKLENTKAVASKTEQNDSLNSNSEVPVDGQKVGNESALPEHFKKFDNDLNGVISYDEILKMIDSFFEDDPNVKAEDISSLIDYFFEG